LTLVLNVLELKLASNYVERKSEGCETIVMYGLRIEI
jgi:hypothetical protein